MSANDPERTFEPGTPALLCTCGERQVGAAQNFGRADAYCLHDRQVAGSQNLRRGHASEYTVDLGGHDEVVLMQSIDLLGLQRDGRLAPTEADIRMMAFSFREFTNLLNKGKRLPEIAKPEAPLDVVSILR